MIKLLVSRNPLRNSTFVFLLFYAIFYIEKYTDY